MNDFKNMPDNVIKDVIESMFVGTDIDTMMPLPFSFGMSLNFPKMSLDDAIAFSKTHSVPLTEKFYVDGPKSLITPSELYVFACEILSRTKELKALKNRLHEGVKKHFLTVDKALDQIKVLEFLEDNGVDTGSADDDEMKEVLAVLIDEDNMDKIVPGKILYTEETLFSALKKLFQIV